MPPYASLTDLCDELNITPEPAPDTRLYRQLMRALNMATGIIDRYTGRSFVPVNGETRAFPYDGEEMIRLGDVRAITAVSFASSLGGQQTPLDPTGYALSHGDATVPAGSPFTYLRRSVLRPWGSGVLYVTGDWGWAAVPDEIEGVCLSLAIRWRNAAKAGFSDIAGTDEATGATIYSRALASTEKMVLDRYRTRAVYA